MNALEEIQTAIEKLTARRFASDEGDDQKSWKLVALEPLNQADIHDNVGNVIAERCFGPDADLIVTLHRTIDAQLAVLRFGMEGARLNEACGTQTGGPVLALARAINGTPS